MLISHRHRLLYYPVPKNACTSLKHWFFALDSGRSFEPIADGDRLLHVHDLLPTRASCGPWRPYYSGYFSFIVLRNPVERFLSAFRNRVRHHKSLFQPQVEKRLREHGLDPWPSLGFFVRNLDGYRIHSPDMNHHFRPQTLFVREALEHVDLVVDVHDLAWLRNRLEHHLGIQVEFPHLQRSDRSTDDEVLHDEDLEFLRQYYEQDYQTLKTYVQRPTAKLSADAVRRYERSVSVAIPCYQAAGTLGRTLQSISEQTRPELIRDILIVDDGSTDGTAALASAASASDPRVRVIRHATNRGRAAARNTLLDHAGGQYIAWLDADDEWMPEKLETQFAYLAQSPDFDVRREWLGTAFRARQSNGKTEDVRPLMRYTAKHLLGISSHSHPPIQLQTVIMPAESLSLAGRFDEALNWAEDYEYALRFCLGGGNIQFPDFAVPLALYNRTLRGRDIDQITAAHDHIDRKHARAYEVHGVDLAFEQASRVVRYFLFVQLENGRRFDGWRAAFAAAGDHRDKLVPLVMRFLREHYVPAPATQSQQG